MQKISIRFKSLEDAAALLVAAAPAVGDYHGFSMRARFATTRPGDVVEQYHRTVRERAWSYGSRLPKSQRDALRCGACGAMGCKLWREYQTTSPRILCGPCALKHQNKVGPIDASGRIGDEHVGRCDQIGWYVPAVPDVEGLGYWGYTSVPADGCEWWRSLPSYPRKVS